MTFAGNAFFFIPFVKEVHIYNLCRILGYIRGPRIGRCKRDVSYPFNVFGVVRSSEISDSLQHIARLHLIRGFHRRYVDSIGVVE